MVMVLFTYRVSKINYPESSSKTVLQANRFCIHNFMHKLTYSYEEFKNILMVLREVLALCQQPEDQALKENWTETHVMTVSFILSGY